MKGRHINLFFPQWQGAGRTNELMKGAREIREKYLKARNYIEVPVSEEENTKIENDILGYEHIFSQLRQAGAILAAEKPDSIFTVGGGCDVEIPSVSYLNGLLHGDLTVLWLDAHGDLNTPESSPSKCFHGMPLRTLLGDGDRQMVETAFSKLSPSQLVLIGQRDLDEPEQAYVDRNKVSLIRPEEFGTERLITEVRAKGSKHLYIHIDLDVLDYGEFPYVMVPAAGGLKVRQLMELLERLKQDFLISGMSLLEYTSSEEKEIKILSELVRLGEDL